MDTGAHLAVAPKIQLHPPFPMLACFPMAEERMLQCLEGSGPGVAIVLMLIIPISSCSVSEIFTTNVHCNDKLVLLIG